MENYPQTIAILSGFELPEEVIQHIQSLMSDQREAARTTLVSKSWYGAWATSPNLSFDEYQLRNRLPQLAKKALQRYEDLYLNIQSFSLHIYGKHSLARELISKAIELGATDLTIHVEDDNTVSFVLPDEVLESQTLTRLSASCCTVDLGRRKKEVITPCFTLKSFNLSGVTVNGDFFKDLSWRFPLIEELTLKQSTSLGVAALENLTLQNIIVTSAFLDNLLRSCRPNFIYIETNRLWDVQEEVLPQLRRLPLKTTNNTSSLVNPRRFQHKFFNDLEDLFAIREGRTFSDTEFVRFELRQLALHNSMLEEVLRRRDITKKNSASDMRLCHKN